MRRRASVFVFFVAKNARASRALESAQLGIFDEDTRYLHVTRRFKKSRSHSSNGMVHGWVKNLLLDLLVMFFV